MIEAVTATSSKVGQSLDSDTKMAICPTHTDPKLSPPTRPSTQGNTPCRLLQSSFLHKEASCSAASPNADINLGWTAQPTSYALHKPFPNILPHAMSDASALSGPQCELHGAGTRSGGEQAVSNRLLEIQSQTTWLLISLGCHMRLSHTTMQALQS